MNGRRAEGERLRVLIVAYACSPYRGSEPGAGWHRAHEASKRFETWVVCEEREFRADVERHLEAVGGIPGLHFHFVPTPSVTRSLRRVPLVWYSLYHHWHRRVLRTARRLHQEVGFDLVHQAGLCGFREPGYLWKLGVPFVWGPVGGTQSYPVRFLRRAGLSGMVKEGIRGLLTHLQLRYRRRVRAAVKRAAVILTANSTGTRHFETVHGVRTEQLLETGLEHVPGRSRSRRRNGPLRILWSGQFEHHKALPLLLRALAELDAPYDLTILGKGSLESRWKREADRRGVRARWLGWLPHDEAVEQCTAADVFVFTSLRDTSGNAVLEALARGVPVVSLDHQGVGDIVTSRCGVKIPVDDPDGVVRGLRRALESLARRPELLDSLSEGAVDRARDYLWSQNSERMAQVYARAAGLRGRAS